MLEPRTADTGTLNGSSSSGCNVSLLLFSDALMAFILSPQNAVEWRVIQSGDTSSFQTLDAGERVVVTGTLLL